MKDLAVDDVTLIYTKLTDRLAFEHQPSPLSLCQDAAPSTLKDR